jgi:hypothetical protein
MIWRVAVEPVKVVARFADGRVMKGLTQDFFPNKDRFHLHPVSDSPAKPIEIWIKDLKAVFFVKDFVGDFSLSERKSYLDGQKTQGRKMEVTFKDGEVLVGSSLGYDPHRQGFFLFPADLESNNLRTFAVISAVKKIRFLL